MNAFEIPAELAAEVAEPPVIGDDAEVAIEHRAEARQDLATYLVAQMARRCSGDPEDAYEQYLQEVARAAGIDLEAAFDEAVAEGWLDGIDQAVENDPTEPGDFAELLTEVEHLVGEAGAFQQVVDGKEGVLPVAVATIEMADLERLQELVARLRGDAL